MWATPPSSLSAGVATMISAFVIAVASFVMMFGAFCLMATYLKPVSTKDIESRPTALGLTLFGVFAIIAAFIGRYLASGAC